ncbi:MAG: type II toxin-antitoxin system RelE/ParE family toxin [Proteobacteria bacterium]|nr:type II toxin-antitoxin system RelE/ParE family toxin [Pseudomonadota bacterium]
MIVEWSVPAKDDLIAIAEYIAADDPLAALDVMDRIDGAVGRLADHPRSGRPGRIATTRELVISDLPYIVAYRIRQERVQILRVLHAARRWPTRARP